MLSRRSLATGALAILTLSAACDRGSRGSGISKTESRALGDVTEVDLACMGTLELVDAPTPSLTVTADDDMLPLLVTRVSDGKLVLESKSELRPKNDVVFRLAAPNLRKLVVSGTGIATTKGLHRDALALELSGAGSIKVAGQVGRLDVTLSGAGEIVATDVTANDVKVLLSGTGNADVMAVASLDITLTGMGSVRYRGNPPSYTKRVDGIGKVVRL